MCTASESGELPNRPGTAGQLGEDFAIHLADFLSNPSQDRVGATCHQRSCRRLYADIDRTAHVIVCHNNQANRAQLPVSDDTTKPILAQQRLRASFPTHRSPR